MFWCLECEKPVEPTLHDVTEKTEAWGETTWEAMVEKRCPHCSGVVEELVACTECKEAVPVSGADQCAPCLAALESPTPAAAPAEIVTLVTNRTPDYLRFHADMEHDAPEPVAPVETFFDMQLDIVRRGGFENIKFHPSTTLAEVGAVCARLGDESHEVRAHVEWVAGKAVVSLHKQRRTQGLESILRAGSEAPLSRLLQRQAS